MGRSWRKAGDCGNGTIRTCVIGYLVSKSWPALRTEAPRGVDPIGIGWSVEVLHGEISERKAIMLGPGRVEVPDVPRRTLLLEAGELKICRRLREAERLARELESMRPSRIKSGGGGENDDLVFAVALAVWLARRAENGFRRQRPPGV
jgi:hypothetical protein